MPSSRLNAKQYKTMALASLGGALEFYDFIIYVFFATILSELFFPADMPFWLKQLQVFGIFSAGYLARPIGGIIIAHFGDLIGRKRMFMISILLMTLPTLAIGLMPTYAQIGLAAPLLLLLFRVLQGAAVGGEVPGAWVFVSEHVSSRHVGFACGVLTAGLTLGIFLGSLVAVVMRELFTEEELLSYAWRLPFILGGVFGLIAIWMRRFLDETPLFQKMKEAGDLSTKAPIKQVLRNHMKSVIVTVLLTWLISAAVIVMILMTPAIMIGSSNFQIDALTLQKANLVSTVTLTLGCVIYGYLSDKLNPSLVIGFGSLIMASTSLLLYVCLPMHPDMVYWLFALAGLGVSVIGAVPAVCVSAFPTQLRFTGMSFSYNIAYAIFGGVTPILVALLAAKSQLGPAWYVSAIGVGAVFVSLYLMNTDDDLIYLKQQKTR